jgi:putative ABC transport system substrate-binding protein
MMCGPIRRRDFIILLGASAASWPLAARAQQRSLPVIGWLNQIEGQIDRATAPFNQGLAETGYVVGRNVALERRDAEGHRERLPELAADLVRRRVAVIIATTGSSVEVAKAATQTIPVVFIMAADPVENGVVASLNRPGGNLTGVALLGAEIAGKRLELLHKLVPAANPIAVFEGPQNTDLSRVETRGLQSAARVLGLRLLVFNIQTENDIAGAFVTLVEQHAGAVFVGTNNLFTAARAQIISLAGRHAIPTAFFDRRPVADGALLGYGPDTDDAYRQVGIYTGRILKGEKPADLPVMQPTRFNFVINLKTARTLGLDIPPMLLAIADEVIE